MHLVGFSGDLGYKLALHHGPSHFQTRKMTLFSSMVLQKTGRCERQCCTVSEIPLKFTAKKSLFRLNWSCLLTLHRFYWILLTSFVSFSPCIFCSEVYFDLLRFPHSPHRKRMRF